MIFSNPLRSLRSIISLALTVLLASCTPHTELNLPPVSGSENEQIQQSINYYRNAFGKTSLEPHKELSRIALQHSRNMADSHRPNAFTLSHQGFGKRAAEAHSIGMLAVSENIAVAKGMGQQNISSIVENWIDSRSHRKNLLGDYTHTGVAVAHAADGSVYATQLFGTLR